MVGALGIQKAPAAVKSAATEVTDINVTAYVHIPIAAILPSHYLHINEKMGDSLSKLLLSS